MNMTNFDTLEIILYALSAFLGLFIGFQIIRILLGGSWSIEQAVFGLFIFNLTATLTLLKTSIGNKHDLKNLERSFGSLAKDFKEHVRDGKIHNI